MKKQPIESEEETLDRVRQALWKIYEEDYTYLQMCEDFRSERNRIEQVTEWISVHSNPPTEGQVCLIIGQNELPVCAKYSKGRFERIIDASKGEVFITLFYIGKTHWMPLPSLPKQD